ncbi:MAG: iron-containing alcohol dehydrogenase [Erysipelotrichaceae bacterium]|nr:iron-containing alcohol dehydrogenase [Erysipelotrichaceae bacterium]
MIRSDNVNVLYGKGAVKKNRELLRSLGERYLIVTGKNSARLSGALDDVLNVLEGKEHVIFDEISENPKVSSILRASELLQDADCVIGIGGGSVLDASKVIACLKTNRAVSEEEIYAQKWENEGLPLVLVGTTAGTGSEVTKVAVLSRGNGKKSSIHHDRFYADHAICDPVYTYSMSKMTAISTAIDALTHCNESYFSNKATDVSRTYALEGIRHLLPGLKMIKEGLSDDLKDEVYLGSLYGGLAINVTGTTFAHNVGYYLTENFGLPHGFACAVFQRDLFEYVSSYDREYTDTFFDQIGMDKESYTELIDSLLPEYDIRISEDTLSSIISRWDNNNSVKNTYGKMDVKDIERILRNRFVK